MRFDLRKTSIVILAFIIAGMQIYAQGKPDTNLKLEKLAANENHFILHAMDGEWEVNFSVRPDGDNPVYGKGSSQNKVIFGLRFLEMSYFFQYDQMPYEGKDYIGYDNIAQEYTYVHMDNMCTNMIDLRGQYDPEKKQLVFEGKAGNYYLEKDIPHKIIITLDSPQKFSYELYVDEGEGYKMNLKINFVKDDL